MRMSTQILRCAEKAAETTVEKVKEGRLKRLGKQQLQFNLSRSSRLAVNDQ